MVDNILQLLGLAARSRNVVTGETIIHKIRNKEVSLVLLASDAGDNTRKKISDKCNHYGIEYIIYGTSIELSRAIGKDNRMAVGILDKGFSKKIKDKIGG